MNQRSSLILAVAATLPALTIPAIADDHAIDLAGTWALKLDPEDVGNEQQWAASGAFTERVRLPGSLQEQGFGVEPTRDGPWTTGIGRGLLDDPKYAQYTTDEDFASPFWLTPDRLYVGPAWYERHIEIPETWTTGRVELVLERAHWGTTVYLDGNPVGPQIDALGTPHVHDLTAAIDARPGDRTLTIRVDNRMIVPVGLDAHSVTDQTQSNWNGIVGDIELRHTPDIWIDNAQVYPNLDQRSIDVRLAIGNATGRAGSGSVTIDVSSRSGRPFEIATIQRRVDWSSGAHTDARFTIPLGNDAPTWTEFEPNVLQLDVSLGAHHLATPFGLREIEIVRDEHGPRFAVNGQNAFFRGTLECAVFPRTGYAPTDIDEWRAVYRAIQGYGLNHVRFHSWCPPRAAFEAADELGVYLMAEASTWPNFKDAPTLPAWLEAEGDRMLRAYGNHPSFVLMGVGNEFWDGGKLNDSAPMIEPAVDRWRDTDTRRYYTTGAGWPQAPANDFHVAQDARMQLYPGLRLSDPPRTDIDYSEYNRVQDVPIITHEIGQWTAFPDLSAPDRSSDFLDARYLQIIEDDLHRAGLGHLSQAFTQASGRFQTILYKAEIEAAIRTQGLAGIQLLGLPDFPGQGFAPVGVLDHNWRSKGYTGPAEYRKFASERVLLARIPARVFERGDTVEVGLELANYGKRPLEGILDWTVRGSVSGEIARGSTPFDAAVGGLTDLATARFTLSNSGPAEKVDIAASVRGLGIENDWSIWAYPAPDPRTLPGAAPDGITITRSIDAATAAEIDAGRAVVVFAPPAYVAADTFGSFRPIFWNTVLFTTQREHTTGALIDQNHPALAGFPTDTHVDWQWWDVLLESKPIPLGGLSTAIDPIVRPIDDWVDPRSLGLIFEARVGRGRVLICAVDLESDLDTRPAARALRASLLDYAQSQRFNPTQTLEPWELVRLFRAPTPMQRLGASVTASSAHPSHGAELAIDGNPATFWHTAWGAAQAQPPHALKIDLGRARNTAGLRYTPRPDGPNGRFKTYRIEISAGGYNWTEVASGQWVNTAEPKAVSWAPMSARFVRLTMIDSVNGQPHGSAAEVEVVVAATSNDG